MFRSGAFVAEHVSPLDAEQVQPNGVDLTVEAVFEQVEAGRISRDGKRIGERRELDPENADERSSSSPQAREDAAASAPTYRLEPGGYVARYGETISIPEGHVGFVLPRSSLMRNSAMLHTAVWDAGYTGRGEGLLEVNHDLELERGARIAQLVFARADHEDTYDGSYQGENLE
ncbi:deoxyuridine 5'-triphosphate nucleotidohydrolase [Natronoarchaeum rubrum]|uniref:deoxyuridine 5'-triphosphate nucleotidohydrolase n=1 Tax=Natronoarchaeum rubrum TaxID=755311 RepID=UPI002112C444|nr:deoxyuridine 5'-triphosphate nucleotidohydrolase [Natronoarchaeum rubrum]HMB50995.1 deoxyuridine 5'-triphosphate nucleotidohydrolase [Natronoarchaeum rubrum]